MLNMRVSSLCFFCSVHIITMRCPFYRYAFGIIEVSQGTVESSLWATLNMSPSQIRGSLAMNSRMCGTFSLFTPFVSLHYRRTS